MTLFGDELNIINISGIIVVFLGVLLYKVALHINHIDGGDLSDDIEKNAAFSRVHSADVYENEPSPRRGRRSRGKNSDPDLVLRFNIDDDDMDEEILLDKAGLSLRGRANGGSALEIDKRAPEEKNPGIT